MPSDFRILIVGSGGREHALAWRIAQSPSVAAVQVAPGNGGTASAGGKISNVRIGFSQNDFPALIQHAVSEKIDLVVIGPEAPLVDGIADRFKAVGIRCFGPSKMAAMMEGSKTFSKDFMARHGIPTPAYKNFDTFESAQAYIDVVDHDIVIKASGLAAGKGVIIPTSKAEAHAALESMMIRKEFDQAGDKVVIEEFLQGEELSVLSFCDGYTIRSLPPAQDHKRALDGDLGPNTGGMGAYAPTRVATPTLIRQMDDIIQATVDGMRKEWMPFVGILFTGFMITPTGPQVLEYNVRGGDPETQTLLPLLSDDTDLAHVMMACVNGWLDSVRLEIKPGTAATTVVACAEGYPGPYVKGRPIEIEEADTTDTFVFHAGTVRDGSALKTAGGRVIAVTALGPGLEDAVKKAYHGISQITFEGMQYRKDIAHRAFTASPKQRRPSDAPLTYAAAGVSIDAGNSLVDRIKTMVKSTAIPGADAEIGGFGGAFDLSKVSAKNNEDWPIVVMACDGVGTKLKIAHEAGIHTTVGIDLVAMSVNDLIVQGACPVGFTDTYTCSQLDVDMAADVVSGVVEGCKLAGCALMGGETAEMPGLLQGTEYDLVGNAWAYIDRAAGQWVLPVKDQMKEGDVLLGLASSGLHSNGFSLVRKISERKNLSWLEPAPWNPSETVAGSLLTPTRIYVRQLLSVTRENLVKGMAHITGGGLTENVPRMLPKHLSASIDLTSWSRPAVFEWLQESGKVDLTEMAKTFNNGIGMVLVVDQESQDLVLQKLRHDGETVYEIGSLVRREGDEGCLLRNLDTWSATSHSPPVIYS